MDVRNLDGRAAVVTGAGSGIGRATALELARRGADLFVCDVDPDGLAETAAGVAALDRRVHVHTVDVAERAQMQAFAAAVHAEVPAVDIVVNNAGVGLGGAFVDVPLDDWDWILGINLRGVVHGCHFFVPPMLARGAGGHVVNIASMAGYFPAPGMTAYCATKYGVIGLSECLRMELAASGIGVTAICPGVIDTPIVASTRAHGAFGSAESRARIQDAFRRRNYGPDKVADGILHAIAKNRAVAPVSPEAWAAYFLKRLAPGALRWMIRRGAERQARELVQG